MTSLTQLRTFLARSPYFAHVRRHPNAGGSESVSVLPSLTSQGNLLAGATTRVAVGFLLNPFSVLKARFEVCLLFYDILRLLTPLVRILQSNIYAYESVSGAFGSLIRQGPSELLRGFLASSLRDAPYAGLFVVFYEGIKRETCQPSFFSLLLHSAFYLHFSSLSHSTKIERRGDSDTWIIRCVRWCYCYTGYASI